MTKIFFLFVVCSCILFVVSLFLHWRLQRTRVKSTIIINDIKISGESNMAVEMQNDQEFDLILQFVDDGGQPTEVESVEVDVFDPDVVMANEPVNIGVGKYSITIKGVQGMQGATQVHVEADARFGEEQVIITYDLAVSTIPNQAESVTVEISPIREQA